MRHDLMVTTRAFDGHTASCSCGWRGEEMADIDAAVHAGDEHYAAIQARAAAPMRFIDAVSPFVRDVLDEPFPWKHGGQVVVNMTREEYDEAVAALEALRD